VNLGRYLLGAGELVLIAAVLGFGAARLRARYLSGWTGAPARLAEVVIAVSVLLVVLEAVGLAQILDPIPILIAALAAGLAMARLGAPLGSVGEPASSPRSAAVDRRVLMGPAATGVALAVVMLVAIHWATLAEHSFSVGLYGGDENWYHLPYPARFAQEGSITALHYASPSYLSWFHPLNSELFHSMGMVVFGRDILSPFLNLIWFAVALLAAWCIGRPFGVAPLTAAAAALGLDLPVFAETQAGAAMSDLFGLTFLLCSVAILLNGYERRDRDRGGLVEPAALAAAGLAAGLALGGKVSYAAPVAGLIVAAVLFSPGGSRRHSALWIGLPALVTGSFWYLRDFWYVHNPFPYVSELGPIDLPGPNQDLSANPFSVAHYLFDGGVWNDYFAPALREQMGPIWFVLGALMLAGIVTALIQRRDLMVRAFGAVAAVTLAFYLLTPAAAEGPEGMPREFPAGLRVLEPALVMGLVLAAVMVGRVGARARWTALGAVTIITLVGTSRDLSFWDSFGQLAGAILIAGTLILLPIALFAAAGSGPRGRGVAVLGASAALLLAVGIGWPRTERYLDHRYRTGDAPAYFRGLSMVPVYRWASGLEDQRIATSGILQYGLYGDDLSNHVQFAGEVGSDHSFREIPNCRDWRTALDEGDYDYVVAMPRYGGTREIQARWTRGPNSQAVLHSGPITVFRLTGPLDPSDCGTLPPL
jgi:hypothetical protein